VLIAALEAERRPSRSGAAWMISGAAIATLGAAAALSRGEPSCAERASAPLAMWDDAARIRVTGNIVESGGSGSRTVARAVTDALDDRVAAWRTSFEDACVASDEAATACLMERRRELTATVRALSEHANAGPDRAQDMVDGLRSIEDCDPTLAAERSDDPDAGVDPAVRARVVELRERLAEVNAAAAAGAARHALALAIDVQADAKAVEWPPVAVAASLSLATSLAEVTEDDAARRAYEDAYYEAQTHGLDPLAVRAATALANLCAYRSDCASEARRWLSHAEAGAQRLDDRALALSVAITTATVLNAEGDTEGSLRAADRGLQIEASMSPRQPISRARLFRARGEALREAGRRAEALDAFERARETFSAIYPEDHPRVLEVRTVAAAVRGENGDSPTALTELEAILRLREENAGPDDRAVGRTLVAMGVVRMTDDPAGAADDFRRAADILDATLGRTSLISLNARLNHGSAMASSGDIAGSVRVFRDVLDRTIEAAGPDHRDLAHLYNNLAFSLLALGDPRGARVEYESGLRIAELTAIEPEVGVRLRLGLADALHRVGDSPDRADRLAADALDTIAGDADGMATIRSFVEEYHPTLVPALDARGW
jgi:tetratricopeptide (TPR) repeat protein